MESENDPAFVRQTQDCRDDKGRFRKGKSGNPRGMAQGTKRHRTRLLEQLLDEHAEDLILHAIDVALAPRGGPTLRTLVELLVPARGRHIQLELPTVASAEDAARAIEAIVAAVACGDVAVEAGEQVIAMLTAAVRAREAADLEKRIAALEATLQGKDPSK